MNEPYYGMRRCRLCQYRPPTMWRMDDPARKSGWWVTPGCRVRPLGDANDVCTDFHSGGLLPELAVDVEVAQATKQQLKEQIAVATEGWLLMTDRPYYGMKRCRLCEYRPPEMWRMDDPARKSGWWVTLGCGRAPNNLCGNFTSGGLLPELAVDVEVAGG